MKRPASAAPSREPNGQPVAVVLNGLLLHCAVSFPLLLQATLAVLHSLLLPPVVVALLLQAALVMLNGLLMSLLDPVVLHSLLLYPS